MAAVFVRQTSIGQSTKSVKTRKSDPKQDGSFKTHAQFEPFESYIKCYRQEPLSLIQTIREGVPAAAVKQMVGDLDIDQAGFLRALNLSTATLNRRTSKGERLPADESERVVGLARLVGQVEAMVDESGDPEGFDAAEWLSRWLRDPLPALGGQKPIDLLDTMAGQALVSQMLSRLQSGAYA